MKIFFSILIIVFIAGCQGLSRYEQTQTIASNLTISDQQLTAYTKIEENAYLVLKDFESQNQLEDFEAKGGTKIFYSIPVRATGTGSLGANLPQNRNSSLILNTPIQRWNNYNLLLYAIYSHEDIKGSIELIDNDKKSYQEPFVLRKNIWNKLDVDLQLAAESIDIGQVNRAIFHFDKPPQTAVYLDDLILLDYQKQIRGVIDGPAGFLYTAIRGRQIRIGSNCRFELVFHDNKMTAWYDLAGDPERKTNLLGTGGSGIKFLLVSNDGRYQPPNYNSNQISTETYATEKSQDVKISLNEKENITYHIYPDGTVLFSASKISRNDNLGITIEVADNCGFEPIIGKIRNPAGNSPDNRIEYVLFRRIGKFSGADLLLAVKPWKNPNLPVQCQVTKNQAILTSQANIGVNLIQGIMRIWPANIDHLGNSEIHIRKFLESPLPDLNQPQTNPESWQPTYKLEAK